VILKNGSRKQTDNNLPTGGKEIKRLIATPGFVRMIPKAVPSPGNPEKESINEQGMIVVDTSWFV